MTVERSTVLVKLATVMSARRVWSTTMRPGLSVMMNSVFTLSVEAIRLAMSMS
jgi:hypothetical protein